MLFVQTVSALVGTVGPEAYQIFGEEMLFSIRYAQVYIAFTISSLHLGLTTPFGDAKITI